MNKDDMRLAKSVGMCAKEAQACMNAEIQQQEDRLSLRKFFSSETDDAGAYQSIKNTAQDYDDDYAVLKRPSGLNL